MSSESPPDDDPEQDGEHWQLRLYVAGMTPVAHRALTNLKAICEAHLAGRYTVQVADLHEDPGLAEDADIVAVPTLVRESPRPSRRIVGDLSNTTRVLVGLDLDPAAE